MKYYRGLHQRSCYSMMGEVFPKILSDDVLSFLVGEDSGSTKISRFQNF